MSTIFIKLFTLLLTLIVVSATNTVANAQESTKSIPPIIRSPEIISLLNDARIAPAELAVDTFLKVVESGKVKDLTWRKEILEEALRMTEGVRHPVQLTLSPARSVVANNTETGFIAIANLQRLDGLSLKSRIIRELLKVDPQRAKWLVFEMNGQLGLKRISCESLLVYDLVSIYDTVGQVVKTAFDKKQVSEGARALFIAPWVDNIESPTQLAPAFKLIHQMQGSEIEKQILYSSFSKVIDRNFNDDRSFVVAAAMMSPNLTHLSAESNLSQTNLLGSYRSFLQKNLSGGRCSENKINRNDPFPGFVESFNKVYLDKPLTIEDIVTTDDKGPAKVIDLLKKSDELQQLRKEVISLTAAGEAEKPLEFDKNNIEWQAKINTFVDKLPNWKPREDFSSIELFVVRSTMHGAIYQATPEGDLRRSVARKWLRFLAASSMQKDDYIHWSKELIGLQKLVKSESDFLVEIGKEFPNHNFNVLISSKRILSQQNVEPGRKL